MQVNGVPLSFVLDTGVRKSIVFNFTDEEEEAANLKEIDSAKVGDTITLAEDPAAEALAGFTTISG